jgi:phosphatidylserine synthase
MKERRPIRLSIPNAITLANLAVGYFAVMAAWNGQIGTAAVYIWFARYSISWTDSQQGC